MSDLLLETEVTDPELSDIRSRSSTDEKAYIVLGRHTGRKELNLSNQNGGLVLPSHDVADTGLGTGESGGVEYSEMFEDVAPAF